MLVNARKAHYIPLQRQRHELRILLVEHGKISVLHVRHVYFTTIPRCLLQNHNLKLPHFRIRFRAKLQNIFRFVLFI